MTEHSTEVCAGFEEELTRYAYGAELPNEDCRRIEQHLKTCISCRELVTFIRKTTELARNKPIRFAPPSEPCPDAESIVALEEGTLDNETSRKLGVHLLHCERCREEYQFLRGLSEERFEDKLPDNLDNLRLKNVDLPWILKVTLKAKLLWLRLMGEKS
ncbi:MAG: zf-HC2 domain-containing protein [Terriglobia bacterium]|jgi:anti-sigma factor RsiW